MLQCNKSVGKSETNKQSYRISDFKRAKHTAVQNKNVLYEKKLQLCCITDVKAAKTTKE
jgi:hypothetical protein